MIKLLNDLIYNSFIKNTLKTHDKACSVGDPALFFTGSQLRLPLKKGPDPGSCIYKFLMPALA